MVLGGSFPAGRSAPVVLTECPGASRQIRGDGRRQKEDERRFLQIALRAWGNRSGRGNEPERTGTVMATIHREIGIFENRIQGYNRRALGLDDLRSACDERGLVFLAEPFPGRGLVFEKQGIPVITVNSRLDPDSAAFIGFWAFFLQHFRPGVLHIFGESPDWEEDIQLQAAILASVALIPTSRLLDPWPGKNGGNGVGALLSKMMEVRVRMLLDGQLTIKTEQAL